MKNTSKEVVELSLNARNPNHDDFWILRGYLKRPDNWTEILKQKNISTNRSQRRDSYIFPSGGYDYPMSKDDY